MNIIIMLSFLTIFLLILLGGHFFVYFSLIKFLDITATRPRVWLGVLFLALAVSFVAATVFFRQAESLAAKIFSFSSGVWLGFGVNLTIAFILSWMVIGILKMSGTQFDHKYLAIGSVIFAILFSAWGVWNAYHPRIKNITVRMDDLPVEWKNKKAVQISDAHIGSVLGKEFLAQVVEKINAQDPDVVFITGDLFDGMDGGLEAAAMPLDMIDAPGGVFFITGNHETYVGLDNVLQALEKTQVKFLDDEMVMIDGMQILGVSYPQRGEKKNIGDTIKNMEGFDPEKASILLYHNPAGRLEAMAGGTDLQLAGHTHIGQLFPFNLVTRLIYGKYHRGLHKEGNFSIYTSVGTGTWGPTMRTNNIPEITVIKFE